MGLRDSLVMTAALSLMVMSAHATVYDMTGTVTSEVTAPGYAPLPDVVGDPMTFTLSVPLDPSGSGAAAVGALQMGSLSITFLGNQWEPSQSPGSEVIHLAPYDPIVLWNGNVGSSYPAEASFFIDTTTGALTWDFGALNPLGGPVLYDFSGTGQLSSTTVPAPGPVGLMALSLLGVTLIRRRRQRTEGGGVAHVGRR